VLLHVQWARAMPDLQPTAREDELHRLLGHTRVPMQVWARGWRARIFSLTRGGDEGEGGDEGGGDEGRGGEGGGGGDEGGGGGGKGGGKGVSLRLRMAHIFTETEMTAFYELMKRCAYRPPDEAVEALAAELGLTAAVARTFVRKELAVHSGVGPCACTRSATCRRRSRHSQRV
jgi:hypothetical protein